MTWSVRAATAFGVGFLPPFPGTWASTIPAAAAAGAFAAGANEWAVRGGLAALAVAFSAVTIAAGAACQARFGATDPRAVVSDEVAGQSIALLPACDPLSALVAFALFRIFDVSKPWLIHALELLPRGYGILADDLGAGAAAGALVLAARLTGVL